MASYERKRLLAHESTDLADPQPTQHVPDLLAELQGLAHCQPIFHSEADFQHALAWRLHELWPEARIRLDGKLPQVLVATCLRKSDSFGIAEWTD